MRENRSIIVKKGANLRQSAGGRGLDENTVVMSHPHHVETVVVFFVFI